MGNGPLENLGGRPPKRHKVVATCGELGDPLGSALVRRRAHGLMLRPAGANRNTTFLEWRGDLASTTFALNETGSPHARGA
jgi:hypothetical protein